LGFISQFVFSDSTNWTSSSLVGLCISASVSGGKHLNNFVFY